MPEIRRPDSQALALDSQGVALQQEGRYSEALELHNQAVGRDPLQAQFLHNRANALLMLGFHGDAMQGFAAAVARDPSLARSRNGYGVALHRLGDLDGAVDAFRHAIELEPSYGEALCNLGAILREQGELDEASAYFLRAIAAEPENGRYYRYLVDGTSGEIGRKFAGTVEAGLAVIDRMPVDQRAEFHFALGKVYEDVERYDEAFDHLRRGNELRRSLIGYAEAEELQFLETMERTFTPEFAAAASGAGNPTERPIFIVGMPRSGTTLVEQILAAVPDVYAGGELRTFESAVTALSKNADAGGDIRSGIRTAGDFYADTIAVFPGRRVVDKMPFNYRFLGLINLALPNARIIAMQRDPLDTCFSMYATFFFDGVNFSYDLAELARYYRAYERLMAHWRTVLPANRLLEVRYEDVVDDLESMAKRILAFCDLPWDAQALEFYRVRRPVRTASHSQVRRPVYRTAMGRAQRFAKHLGPLIEALER
jgi:tetratricopeptide (TPR) repeat protein